MKMLKEAISDKLLERMDPGFATFNRKEQAVALRLALVDDFPSSIVNALSGIAQKVGPRIMDFISSKIIEHHKNKQSIKGESSLVFMQKNDYSKD